MNQSTTYAVILAGGSGTRFWPASRKSLPKQLLPLGPAAPQTLLRSTVERLKGVTCKENLLVATGAHLVGATRQELSDIPERNFLVEPLAKNTAPCIAWAALEVAAKSPEGVLCVLPSDQHAADPEAMEAALQQALLVAGTGRLCTIGIVPHRPETGYGYIQKSAQPLPIDSKPSSSDGSAAPSQKTQAFSVERFVEKPDLERAKEYLQTGEFLWNAGIFVFRAKDMLEAIARHAPELFASLMRLEAARSSGQLPPDAIQRYFDDVEPISIDYAVMEKQSDLAVVPADFGWSDLGSWESAWELSPKDARGNASPQGTVLVEAENNLVVDLREGNSESAEVASKKKVIALVGVEDLCVVETDDALLVMPRSRSQDVREVVATLKSSERSEFI
ncbi:MAG: NTP transferase domain-containing protein [Polyangiaceae bacterium]|nr:NTP transferase domain-containing protein [Polyangiaceae bacterium]